ncbi:unnamed protein product, partial [Sphagnum troendelagicum]
MRRRKKFREDLVRQQLLLPPLLLFRKQLATGELSNVLRGDAVLGEGEQGPLGRADLVKDMSGNAKTTTGRLLLIKEMLQLPVTSLKGFTGTKS